MQHIFLSSPLVTLCSTWILIWKNPNCNWPPTHANSAIYVHFERKFSTFGPIPTYFEHSSCVQFLCHYILLSLNSKFKISAINGRYKKNQKMNYFNSGILYEHLQFRFLNFKAVKTIKRNNFCLISTIFRTFVLNLKNIFKIEYHPFYIANCFGIEELIRKLYSCYFLL
jgi:hypothetical protein